MKRYVFLAIALTLLNPCSDLRCEESAPAQVQEPIPPVNIEKVKEPENAPAAPIEQEKPVNQAPADKMGKPAIPKKLEMDTNYDGRVDRIEMYDSEGRIQRLDLDTNGDGNFDEWMIFENGKPRMKGKDRNEDGRTDTWIEY